MSLMTDATNPVDQLGVAIADGLFDADLDRLERAINARRRVIAPPAPARLSLADLRPGDRVRIKTDAPLSPKYILGVTGTVKDTLQANVSIRFDADQYTGRFGTGVRIKPYYLEKI